MRKSRRHGEAQPCERSSDWLRKPRTALRLDGTGGAFSYTGGAFLCAPGSDRGQRRLSMARIVMKFGGTSVADLDRIHNVARHVKREVDAGHEVAVVVSAMSGKTNELVGWVQGMPKVTGAASPFFDAREYDAIVASGEQVTSGLLAIALQSMGVNARSWQGWQIPVKTDNAHGAARIVDIDGSDLVRRFGEGQVAVIAGFQGIGPDNRIATLGRGGSAKHL